MARKLRRQYPRLGAHVSAWIGQMIRLAPALLLLLCALKSFAQTPTAGTLDGLRVSSDFPGGSARVLSLDPGKGFVRITPAGDPDRGWPCWWYLRLDGMDTSKPVVLEVVANESVVLGNNPGQTRKLPPYWALPARAAFSTDGRNWKQTAPGERQEKRCVYRVQSTSRTLWLAWGPPFSLQDANELIQRAAKLTPYAKPFELARTREGRSVPALLVSQPGVAAPDRYGVWILARQHAWECGGSWVACGLTEWLVSHNPEAEFLRKKADITIVPIMDVDNVERGNGGKKERPHDQNEDWGPEPFFPQVRAAMGQLSALAKAGRLDVCLDLHNPDPAERNVFIYIPPKPLLDTLRLANQNAFSNSMRAELKGPIPFLGKLGPCGNTYDPVVDKSVDVWAAYEGGSHAVSLTIETAWNTPASTPTGYRKIGEQIGRSIEVYLRRPVRSGVGR